MKRLFGMLLAALLLVGTTCGMARAAYPEKAITCIVPFAPGGSADISVRMVADYLAKELGQPLVIINKGGGSGISGLNFGLKSRNDGYTVVGGAIDNTLVSTYFLGATPFDLDDIVFVGAYLVQDRLLLTRPDKPYKTWKEFIEYARDHPGTVTVGSGASQVGMEVVHSAAIKEGVKFRLVMYKSGGPATADLLGGHIDACDLGVGSPGYQAARKGDLIILANLGTSEIPFFPDVPRLKEMGYPFAASLRCGFCFPKATPQEIRDRWEQALAKVMANQELQEKMKTAGFAPSFLTGKEYEEFSRKTVKDFQEMVQFNQQDK